MTLAKTVTKMFPTEDHVGIRLVLTDDARPDLGTGAQVVVNQIFKINVPIDADMALEAQKELGGQVQAAIDKYQRLRAIYVKPAYQTKVTQIDSKLTNLAV